MLVRHFGRPSAEVNEIAYLADALAHSGQTLQIRAGVPTADVVSTGGPTSLTTLLAPLALRELGYCIPKLGVPGRPAGGIDVLAQIPGYAVNLGKKRISQILRISGYAHFLAGPDYAPFDAALFQYRKKTGTIANSRLATASLLAKKIAAGVRHVGLDVRVGAHGNFGKTFSEAAKNADFFCAVAAKLGIRAICFLTDGDRPYQPYIGRAESLLALAEIFEGRSSGSLARHLDLSVTMAMRVAGASQGPRPAVAAMARHFEENLRSQGSSLKKFNRFVQEMRGLHVHRVLAPRAGVLNINLGVLRSVFERQQKEQTSPTVRFPDPVGIILSATTGERMQKGESLAQLRVIGRISTSLMREIVGGFELIPERKARRMEIGNA